MNNNNYGIKYCESVLEKLSETEDRMFEKSGYGFDRFSREYLTALKYKELLKIFRIEKQNGSIPSYDPGIHGCF